MEKRPTSLTPCCPRKAEIMLKYGSTAKEFLLTVTPAQQSVLYKNIHDCYFGDYPTLRELNGTYTPRTAQAWLVPQLVDLSEYCGVKEKFTTNQLSQCSDIIASDYSYLKVSEIMLFLARFKRCCYGRFYGSVDPLVIIEALKEFCRERNIAYYEQCRDEEKKNLASTENVCSWEDYKKSSGHIRNLSSIDTSSFVTQSAPVNCNCSKKSVDDEMRKIAKRLTDNIYGCDAKVLNIMKETFAKKYGCSPEACLSS